ncbi:hypothetical protein DPMN_187998 [Dreissena polymorpha]|uniref:Uncharacterized protein n=1 Tax=Dreissena polymorpha TaxID=45954 RepID=A0A9D4DPB6_DREPO|nr:hypothetical protein DPMN_187998 [Dreissena polymorpha]
MLTVLCGSLLKTVICWPSNNDKQTVIDEFQNKKGFHGVLRGNRWDADKNVGTKEKVSKLLQ